MKRRHYASHMNTLCTYDMLNSMLINDTSHVDFVNTLVTRATSTLSVQLYGARSLISYMRGHHFPVTKSRLVWESYAMPFITASPLPNPEFLSSFVSKESKFTKQQILPVAGSMHASRSSFQRFAQIRPRIHCISLM